MAAGVHTATGVQMPTMEILQATQSIKNPFDRLEAAIKLVFLRNPVQSNIGDIARCYLSKALSELKTQYEDQTSQKATFVFDKTFDSKSSEVAEDIAHVITRVMNGMGFITPLITKSGDHTLKFTETSVSLEPTEDLLKQKIHLHFEMVKQKDGEQNIKESRPLDTSPIEKPHEPVQKVANTLVEFKEKLLNHMEVNSQTFPFREVLSSFISTMIDGAEEKYVVSRFSYTFAMKVPCGPQIIKDILHLQRFAQMDKFVGSFRITKFQYSSDRLELTITKL